MAEPAPGSFASARALPIQILLVIAYGSTKFANGMNQQTTAALGG